jgi:hypothetical protein
LSTFVCPHCGAASHNPNDVRERYCGRCHRFVDDPALDPPISPAIQRILDELKTLGHVCPSGYNRVYNRHHRS